MTEMKQKNYADSHKIIPLSSKRLEESPFSQFCKTEKTLFGIYANRLYALSTGDDPIESYWKLRKEAMLYSVPEKPIDIRGEDAVKLLEKVFCRLIGDMKLLCARYALACNPEGGIVMDGIVIRFSKDHFWYIHANGNFKLWLIAHSNNLNVKITDQIS